MQAITATWGKSTKLSGNTFTRTGYTFTGWNTKADGSGKTYKDKASVKNLCTDSTGVVTLYAQWKLVTYKITYTLAGGKNPTGAPKTYTVLSGTVTLPTPTRSGYTFTGWTDADESVVAQTFDAAKSVGNKKLKATWKKN